MTNHNARSLDVSVEVPNRALPVHMRLARFRARPVRPVLARPTLPRLAPMLPVIGVAGLALAVRRDRRPA